MKKEQPLSASSLHSFFTRLQKMGGGERGGKEEENMAM